MDVVLALRLYILSRKCFLKYRLRLEKDSCLTVAKEAQKLKQQVPIFKIYLFFFFLLHHTFCGILVPFQGSYLGSLQWKHGVLTTGLPGKSPKYIIKKNFYWNIIALQCVYKIALPFCVYNVVYNTIFKNLVYLSFFFLINFYFLFLAMLGLHCFSSFFPLIAVRGGFSLVVVCGFLIVMASLVAPRLQSTGSVLVSRRLSYSTACGIFLDQGLNPCLLHWQVDSLPLSHQGSPLSLFSHCFQCIKKVNYLKKLSLLIFVLTGSLQVEDTSFRPPLDYCKIQQ